MLNQQTQYADLAICVGPALNQRSVVVSASASYTISIIFD